MTPSVDAKTPMRKNKEKKGQGKKEKKKKCHQDGGKAEMQKTIRKTVASNDVF